MELGPRAAPARVDVLGIEVGRAELVRWRDWLMPGRQPFLVPAEVAAGRGLSDEPERLTRELRDTFAIYGDQADAVCWLDEVRARALPARVRGRQATHHEWPSADLDADVDRLVRYLEDGLRRSRHAEVSEESWYRIAAVLPGARRIAGRFAGRSGPNCFGAVMASAGVAAAGDVWMLREPFEDWLAASTRRGGADGEPGTVLVWRAPDGLVQHAAITLGGGLALHKPSQGWQSPTKILTTDEVIRSSRATGRRLHRYSVS